MTYNMYNMPGPGDLWLPPDDDCPTCCGNDMVHVDEAAHYAAEYNLTVPAHPFEWWCLECDAAWRESDWDDA